MARNDTAFFDTTVGCLRARWHPLQEIGDERQKGILKCLNIKYASIPYRWAAPRAESLDWPGTRDCTTFGPGCPQTSLPLFDVDGIPMFGRPGQNSLAIRADHEDEFECLNLNVYTPARKANDGTATVERGKLPVLVWVHGGAYQVGSGSVDAYGEFLTNILLKIMLTNPRTWVKTGQTWWRGLRSWARRVLW